MPAILAGRFKLLAALAVVLCAAVPVFATPISIDNDKFVVLHLRPGAVPGLGDELVGGDLTQSSRNGETAVWVLAEWPRHPRPFAMGRAVVITTTYRVKCSFNDDTVSRTEVDAWAESGLRLSTEVIREPARHGDMGNIRSVYDFAMLLGCAQAWKRDWGATVADSLQAANRAAQHYFSSNRWDE